MPWVLVALGTILQRFYHQRPGLAPSDLPSERSHYSSVSGTQVTPEKATFRSASRDFRKNHVCFPIRGEIRFFHLLLLCEQSEENDESGVSKHTCLYLSVSVTQGVQEAVGDTFGCGCSQSRNVAGTSIAAGWAWQGEATGKWDEISESGLDSSESPGQEGWDGGRSGGTMETTGGAPSALRLLPSCRTCTHPHSLTPQTSAHHPVSLQSSADHFQLLIPEILISPSTPFCPRWL